MSKGGSETTTTEIPDWLKQPAIRNLQRAEDVQRIPYMPYRGADVAAFTPATNASFNTNIGAAEAFGLVAPGSLTATSGMPEPTEFAGGWSGYSSMPLYDQALEELKANQPEAWEQYQALYGANVPTQRDAPPSGGGGGGGSVPITDPVHTTSGFGDTLNLGGGDVTPAEALDQLDDDRSKMIQTNPDGSFVNVLGTGDKEAQDAWRVSPDNPANQPQIPTGQTNLGSGVYDRALADAASQPPAGALQGQLANQISPVDYPTQVNPAIPTGQTSLGASTQGSFTQGGYTPALDEIIEKWNLENSGK